MKNLITLVFIALLAVGGKSQDIVKEYASSLLELEKGVTTKAFLKKWKEHKNSWENSCNSATTVKQVADLTALFVSKVYEAKMIKPMIVPTDNLYEQCNALSNIYSILKDNDLPEWKAPKHTLWFKRLTDLTARAKLFEEDRAAKRRALLIKSAMSDFEDVFKVIFEDSKSGSFANIIDGDKVGEKYDVKVKFNTGENQKIIVDGDNLYQFFVDFKTQNDVLLAEELMNAMLVVIANNVPEGFEKVIVYDKQYLKNEGYRYEFKAEKFVFTAKQSSVLIGASKDGSKVMLSISEPVFKR